MKPGRDLDALVAEKVMGWIQSSTGMFSRRLEDGRLETRSANILPPYSTDIAAAWEVVTMFKNREFAKHLFLAVHYKTGHWEASFGDPGFTTPAEFWGAAETAPHAICLAALKAVRA